MLGRDSISILQSTRDTLEEPETETPAMRRRGAEGGTPAILQARTCLRLCHSLQSRQVSRDEPDERDGNSGESVPAFFLTVLQLKAGACPIPRLTRQRY